MNVFGDNGKIPRGLVCGGRKCFLLLLLLCYIPFFVGVARDEVYKDDLSQHHQQVVFRSNGNLAVLFDIKSISNTSSGIV